MQKLSILIVDDEKSQRELLRDFLRSEGHTVTEADNGEKAIKMVLNEYNGKAKLGLGRNGLYMAFKGASL